MSDVCITLVHLGVSFDGSYTILDATMNEVKHTQTQTQTVHMLNHVEIPLHAKNVYIAMYSIYISTSHIYNTQYTQPLSLTRGY